MDLDPRSHDLSMILVETIEHFAADRRQTFARKPRPLVIRRRWAESVRTVVRRGLVVVRLGTSVHPDFALPASLNVDLARTLVRVTPSHGSS